MEIKKLHTHQSGRSMIEMLGVLAIIGVLSVGGLAGYNLAMSRVRTNKVMDELQLATVNIRTAVPNSVYTDISSIAQSMKLLNDLNSALAVFGTGATATVSGAKSSGGTVYDRFSVNLSKIPVDLCRRIVMLDWGTSTYVTKTMTVDLQITDGNGNTTSGSYAATSTVDTGTPVAVSLCRFSNKNNIVENISLYLK
jgi:Tfp pilus assembly protein PilE